MQSSGPRGNKKLYLLCSLAAVIHGQLQQVQSAPDTTTQQTASNAAAVGPIESLRLTQRTLSSVGHIRHQIYSFWQKHGPDTEHGGFHGTLGRSGEVVPPTFKGLVQQTRHVWAFSTYYLRGYLSSAAVVEAGAASRNGNSLQTSSTNPRETAILRKPHQHRNLLLQTQQASRPQHQHQQEGRSQQQLLNSQQMAKTAFEFVVQHMHDPVTDLFHWTVTQDGQLLQDNKVIYGQWFVLYSFSQYYTAFRDTRARDLALRCFRAMDAAWHNSTLGGYDEPPASSIPPLPTEAVAAKPTRRSSAKKLVVAAAAVLKLDGGNSGASSKASAARVQHKAGPQAGRQESAARRSAITQQQQQQPLVRTLNVAMHGLEALTALHKVTKDPTVLRRVREYVDIICTRLQRSRGLIFEEYIPAATGLWQPAPGSVVNYGHNLESTWLVADCLDYLSTIDAISPRLARQYRDVVMSIGAAAVRDGFDAKHGGVYESGLPVVGPQSTVKVWWIQAESMLALWKLHQHYDLGLTASSTNSDTSSLSSSTKYLQLLARTAEFVRDHVTDNAGGGEQFWQVEADGSWTPTNDGTKGNVWKASYHDSRSVLFLEQWMRESY